MMWQILNLIGSNVLTSGRNIVPTEGNAVHYSIKYISHQDNWGKVKVSNQGFWV